MMEPPQGMPPVQLPTISESTQVRFNEDGKDRNCSAYGYR